MKPGRRVALPRSITRAPAGTGRPEPAALILPPSTTTTALATVESARPSNIRAALSTTTSDAVGDGDGVWAPAEAAAPASKTGSRPLRISSPPEKGRYATPAAI